MEIQYRESESFQGVWLFRCERLHADLTPTACARNVAIAAAIQCARCPIGKVHALECAPQPPREKRGWQGRAFRGTEPAKSCVRCGAATYRLLGGLICASCYNRQRELRIGSNRKGRAPKKAAELLHRGVCLLDVGGDAVIFEIEYCTGRAEAAQVVKRRWPGARLADYEIQTARTGIPLGKPKSSIN